MPHLMSISVFWHNDLPTGLGFTLTDDVGDLNTILNDLQTSWSAMWHQAQLTNSLPALIDDLRTQLTSISSSKGCLGLEECLIALGNVWVLESHGQMITDEFNGLQLAYIDDR